MWNLLGPPGGSLEEDTLGPSHFPSPGSCQLGPARPAVSLTLSTEHLQLLLLFTKKQLVFWGLNLMMTHADRDGES